MDEEVSSFIDDSLICSDTSIYNCNIPNITRSYEDAMNDKSLNVKMLKILMEKVLTIFFILTVN